MTTRSDDKTTRRKTALDGKTWARYSISIWSDLNRTPEERRLGHPAMFPLALPSRLIEIFTLSGDLVLDPFAGTGSTVIAAARLDRRGLGLEVNPAFSAVALERLNNIPTARDLARIYCVDARRVGEFTPASSVRLCVTSPPYWNILSRPRSADHRPTRDYSGTKGDLSRINDYQEFIAALGDVFTAVRTVLVPGGYCVLNVMDLRKKAKFYPLHMDVCRELESRGYILDDIIIWDRHADYNRLRPLGYPYVFRINKVHEFLLIFRRPFNETHSD